VAEVKVKVTAQNEVRTGLQQALAETRQFGQEATKSMRVPLNLGEEGLEPLRKIQQELRDVRAQAGKPIPVASLDGSGEQLATTSASGSSAIRGLAIDLANATSPAQAFEAVIRRVSTAFGGLVAASAGFAIGSIIRRTLEDAAAGLEQLIDKSQELQQKFSNLSAPTTTFSQLTTAVQGAAAEIEALKKANEDLQSGIGFQLADSINAFDLSTAANRETESGVENIRAGSTVAILAMMQRENELAKARTEEERALIGLQAARAQFREGAEKADPGAGGVAADRLFAAQDSRGEIDKDRASAKTEASLQAQADKQRAINEDNKRSLEERLAREKQGLADLEQFGGGGIENRREQSIARIAELEKQITSERDRAADAAEREAEQREQTIKRDAQTLAGLERSVQTPDERRAALEDEQAALAEQAASLAPDDFAGRAEVAAEAQRIAGELRGLGQDGGQTGSFGASSLQRIGFASDEFFDTRTKKDPADETRRAADFVKQIIDILKKSEPLVLSSSN
jgi:hypothetical protein